MKTVKERYNEVSEWREKNADYLNNVNALSHKNELNIIVNWYNTLNSFNSDSDLAYILGDKRLTLKELSSVAIKYIEELQSQINDDEFDSDYSNSDDLENIKDFWRNVTEERLYLIQSKKYQFLDGDRFYLLFRFSPYVFNYIYYSAHNSPLRDKYLSTSNFILDNFFNNENYILPTSEEIKNHFKKLSSENVEHFKLLMNSLLDKYEKDAYLKLSINKIKDIVRNI
jgi:hypothetical protein